MSFCFLYNVVTENYSVQKSSRGGGGGGGGGLWPAQGLRTNLSGFRTFFRFALVWFCLFLLPLGVWEGLRFVIVALPGLFSYLFFRRRCQ